MVQSWERFALMNSVVALAIISISSLATLREVSTYTGPFQGTSSALGRDWDKEEPEHEAKGVFREFGAPLKQHFMKAALKRALQRWPSQPACSQARCAAGSRQV